MMQAAAQKERKFIQIHMIQNHAPANLNRDDLGAPKTCWFGGVLRARISSQCLKRSIRMSDVFGARLRAGIRTRRLVDAIAGDDDRLRKRAISVLRECGLIPKKGSKKGEERSESKMLVYTTHQAVREMRERLARMEKGGQKSLAGQFAELIEKNTAAPDMALVGRMLEPSGPVWNNRDMTVEAALQTAHAISTHEARPEVDYYVAADDLPGQDAGAGFVDEALFTSACFYKYYSIDWSLLLENLSELRERREALAAHTVGAFVRAAALVTPTGKQNSFAAHNLPDGILVEVRSFPVSYANAFARPVPLGEGARDAVAESIARLEQYMIDLDEGYGAPDTRIWFSPNLRHSLRSQVEGSGGAGNHPHGLQACKSLEGLVSATLKAIDARFDWEEVSREGILWEEVR